MHSILHEAYDDNMVRLFVSIKLLLLQAAPMCNLQIGVQRHSIRAMCSMPC